MSDILMINLPFSGHTNPTLPLARMLVQKGHRVSYINAEEFRVKIEETGAKFIPYKRYPVTPTEKQKKHMCFLAAYDTALDLQEHFDLLIYEMFFYPGIKIAREKNIPCVRQFSQPAWNEQTVSDANVMFRISCKMIDRLVLNKKAKIHMGLQNTNLPKAVLFDEPDLNIVYIPEIFQSHRETFAESYLFCIPPMDTVVSSDTIPFHEMKHPIIYISLGSIISNKGFCKECIRAFGNTEFSVILNTGKVRKEDLGEIPPNIFAYSYVPQIEVLKHADIFLTHCGMNSVNESLMAGVPMITMPFINDQVSNARRVLELGVGRKIRSFPSSSKEMYRTAQMIVNNPLIYNKCKEVSEQLTHNNFVEVVHKIETLCKVNP